jgi:hypothetical protein
VAVLNWLGKQADFKVVCDDLANLEEDITPIDWSLPSIFPTGKKESTSKITAKKAEIIVEEEQEEAIHVMPTKVDSASEAEIFATSDIKAGSDNEAIEKAAIKALKDLFAKKGCERLFHNQQ